MTIKLNNFRCGSTEIVQTRPHQNSDAVERHWEPPEHLAAGQRGRQSSTWFQVRQLLLLSSSQIITYVALFLALHFRGISIFKASLVLIFFFKIHSPQLLTDIVIEVEFGN